MRGRSSPATTRPTAFVGKLLNQKRYQEEVAAGLHDKKGKKKAKPKKTKPTPASHATLPLFASMNPAEES